MEEQQRNMLLAVVLSVMVMLGWTYFIDGPRQAEDRRIAQEQAEARSQAQSASQATNGDAGIFSSGATSTGAAIGSGSASGTVAADGGERLTFKSAAIDGSINSQGARIDEIVLNKYRETLDEDSDNIKFLQPTGKANPYFTDYGWIAVGNTRQTPTPDTVWDVESTSDTTTVLTTELDGLAYKITYALGEDDYIVSVDQEVTNTGSDAVNLRPFGRVIRYGEPETSGFFILHEGPIGFFSEDYLEEISYKKLRNADKGDYDFKSTGGWQGFTDKYWLAALLPQQSEQIDFTYDFTPENIAKGTSQFYQTYYRAAQTTLNPGQTGSYSSNVFLGAKEVNLLDKYSQKYNLAKFDRAVDFGWFYWLTKPFFKAITFINSIVGNFGVAILILTLFIKLLLFPLANASYRSMSKMKLLAPKIAELKERHGDDRAALQQATMKFYKEEGVNPLGGCLPILVQIPIFFALYKVLLVNIEMRHAPFFGWIKDLSAKDPTSIFNLFGLLPYDTNTGIFALLGFLSIGIWPILMGVTMFLQQRLNPPPTDPIQAKVMAFLPLIFTFILAPFAAGLVIYWTWNNTLTFIQQWWIMKNTKLETVKVKPANQDAKPGFMARLMERAAEKQKETRAKDDDKRR